MAWDGWPAWLKGGIFALIIPITGLLLLTLTRGSDQSILVSILFFFGEGGGDGILLGLVIWFAIGAAIGYLIQRFKK
jgi:hypothetical protein